MGIKGRLSAAVIVVLFNIVRYFYYNVHLGLPFGADFFILTAFFLSFALYGGYQYDRADYMARRDPLTGAYNRRSLGEHVRRLAGRRKSQFAVVLFDLDDFKEINDRFGHETGDMVLITFTKALKSFLDKRGIVARWGGDEFLAVVQDPQENFKTEFPIETMKQIHALSFNGGQAIGVSFGIAVFPEDGKDLEALVIAADREMYENKAIAKY
ncbi:GGDEF domain-containing protein [Bhargavaea ullalensis]|uniref:Diguanylate cyclase (GGDEF)-like protein n=1 Tax=Bhargavaea ullalensis TaxID=1265685 RepID=A0ABV2G9G7_9BACL